MPKIVPKINQTCFEHVLWQFFRKKNLPRVPCRVGPSKFFQNSKKFNIPKLPKFVSKTVQTCFQHALGQFFRFFYPVFHAGLFRFSGLKNMSSVFRTQKIWVQFSGLEFWGRYLKEIEEKNQKSFKVPKCPKTFSSVQTCFGAIFRKKFFCPVFHGVVESFRKNQKKIKIAKMPRIVPKRVQTCFEHALGRFSEFFCPVFPAGRFRFSGLEVMCSGSRI